MQEEANSFYSRCKFDICIAASRQAAQKWMIGMEKEENTSMAQEQLPGGEIRVSVRNLVEFLLRQGNIDSRRQGFSENAMQEGGRIHRMLQKRMGAEYQAEVSLRCICPGENYHLVVEGRADGIIDTEKETVIDEIKGTYRDLNRMQEPVPVHIAQAKCYGYMYALQKQKKEIRLRLTYCNIDTEDIRYFFEEYTFEELQEWFEGLIREYRKWSDYTWQWRRQRQESIEALEFPFPYREGQKELAANVYRTIYHGRKLFLEAPTGAGKTISTLFPAIKAMGRGLGERIFYLTAKTITRTVAEDTIELLRGRGLQFKSVILTAKEKICFMEKTECTPEHCPYARGHYDRINEAIYDLLTHEESFNREKIEEYAQKHQVCPFELCLDMSLFADGIIGDYNYLFDPHIYLKRFFGEGSGGNYLFLIDEAHNLLERGREMYSASLYKEDFAELSRQIKQTIVSEIGEKSRKNKISGQMTLELTKMSEMDGQMEQFLSGGNWQEEEEAQKASGRGSGKGLHGGKSVFVRKGYAEKVKYHLDKCSRELLVLKRECPDCRLAESIEGFVQALLRLHSAMGEYLEEQEEEEVPAREALLDFYFAVSHFLMIYERLDEHYVKYTQLGEDNRFLIKLFCVNPRENLKECMMRGRSSVLFSATFLPIQYYKRLLGGDKEDYEVYAQTVFHPKKRALLIAGDVTSKYSRRSEEEYKKIARYIHEIVKNRRGNYMVFCPSYSFMQTVCELYQQNFAGEEAECIWQSEFMSEEEREAFLTRFRGNEDFDLQPGIGMEIELEEDRTLIGFCVLGGIFSEGIDLKNDSLIGVIIVGTGLPQVCSEREILRDYFSADGESGFDYSYRYPGMNKVLQAAGRVIRTAEDVGIIALLDERFLQPAYRKMFPREWNVFERVKVDTVAGSVKRFWDSW